MGMTMTQKILASHANLKEVKKGQLVEVNLDLILGNDITTPVAIREFEKLNIKKVFDDSKVAIVLDHFTPNKDIKSAQQCRVARNFANNKNIKNYFDVGDMGIEHCLLPEKGLVTAGDVVIGADSHTCTYGALGAFSTGIGSTDMAAGMASGKAWFKVPGAMKFVLKNKLGKYISGKDIILHIIGKIGVDGARYMSMEFVGNGVSYLTMDDRFTICNMAIEAGAKNGIFPVDEKTMEYIKSHPCESTNKIPKFFSADEDADYDEVIEIDLSELKPTVAFPHLPENTKTIDEITENIKIDQVVIGSCTNGRINDLKIVSEIMKGKKVAKDVRCIVFPGTQSIYLEAIEKGYISDLVKAGAAISTPTCGPCLGGHMGILAEGERAVSTTNRNFVGRMGHVDSEIYLASPAVAAASSIAGKICSPEAVCEVGDEVTC